MKERKRMTLAEMAAVSHNTVGRLVCPKCACPDFKTYKTTRGVVATFRYKECRHCGHRLLTTQPPEQMIRSVETVVEDVEDDGEGLL
jgi:hypothetical protein